MFGKKKNLPASVPQNEFENASYGVERVTKKRRGKKIAIISGATAVAVIGGGIAAFNLSPFVENQVRLRVMKPEKYYAWVYEENSKDLAKRISEKYDQRLDRYENGQRTNLTLKYEPSEDAKKKFLDSVLDSEDDPEVVRELTSATDSTDSLSISLDAKMKKGDAMLTLAGLRNDDTLASFDLLLDNDEGDLFMRVPELTEKWLGFSLNDYLSDKLGDDDYRKFADARREIMSDPRSFLSPDELEDEIIRYVDVWNDTIEDVKIKKSEKVEIGEIEVKYIVASVKIDEELGKEIAKNMLEEARGDDVIKGIVVDKLGVATEDEYNDFFDEALAELDEDDDDDDYDYDYEDDDSPAVKKEKDESGSVTFKTYIDAKGVIRGFEVKEDSDNCLRAIIGKDGKKVCGEAWLKDDGEKKFDAELYAEEEGKEEYSGKIDVIIPSSHYDFDADERVTENKKYTVEFDDFKIVNKERNYFDADITIITPDLDPIELEFDATKDSQSVSYEIVVDDVDYGKATLSWSTVDDDELEIPDKGDCYMTDPEKIEDEFTNYVSRDQFKTFVNKVMKGVGFSDDFSEKYAGEIADEAYDKF